MQIALTNSGFTLIDEVDSDLSELTWTRSINGYATRSRHRRVGFKQYSNQTISLHREVIQRVLGEIDWSQGLMVDHINQDKLDNRRSNLRLATRSLNMMNVTRTSPSGYTGVSYDKNRRKYQVHVSGLPVGRFADKEEAAWMRDQWALGLHGDFATLNFEYV